MSSRLELQSKLEELLGSENVYYQPPESAKINYPGIVFNKTIPMANRANNKIYSNKSCYEIIVMDKKPDNDVINKILELPYCSYDRHYFSDNLNHDVLTLYY